MLRFFWQFACGHALTGEYLKDTLQKTENDSCGYCASGAQQTRTHLFTQCTALRDEVKDLQRECLGTLRREAKKKGKKPPKTVAVGTLFAQECLTGAVMDFLKRTKIGRTGRPPE